MFKFYLRPSIQYNEPESSVLKEKGWVINRSGGNPSMEHRDYCPSIYLSIHLCPLHHFLYLAKISLILYELGEKWLLLGRSVVPSDMLNRETQTQRRRKAGLRDKQYPPRLQPSSPCSSHVCSGCASVCLYRQPVGRLP